MTDTTDRIPVETVPIEHLTARRLDHRQRPVLVTGAAGSMALTPEQVVAREGTTIVPVTLIDRGSYLHAEQQRMPLAEYFERIAHPDRDAPIPYLAELSYDEYFPELAAELVDPPALVGERFEQRVMYLGRLVHSQIHYHSFGSAILFCLHGQKLVRLFAPDQSGALYKAPRRNFCEVNVSSIGENAYAHDGQRFPRFAGADYTDVIVDAGQALYIPIYWWHGIQNLDEVSLSAVYFWSQTWRHTWRRFVPAQIPPAPMRADYVWDLASRTEHELRALVARKRR